MKYNNVGGLALPDNKTYDKATPIMVVWYRYRYKQIK